MGWRNWGLSCGHWDWSRRKKLWLAEKMCKDEIQVEAAIRLQAKETQISFIWQCVRPKSHGIFSSRFWAIFVCGPIPIQVGALEKKLLKGHYSTCGFLSPLHCHLITNSLISTWNLLGCELSRGRAVCTTIVNGWSENWSVDPGFSVLQKGGSLLTGYITIVTNGELSTYSWAGYVRDTRSTL